MPRKKLRTTEDALKAQYPDRFYLNLGGVLVEREKYLRGQEAYQRLLVAPKKRTATIEQIARVRQVLAAMPDAKLKKKVRAARVSKDVWYSAMSVIRNSEYPVPQ